MQQMLHLQADRIEQVLSNFGIPSRVIRGTITPRLVRYQLSTPLGVKVKRVTGLAEEIALGLGTCSCRVYREDGVLLVEIPRDDPQVVHLLPLCRKIVMAESRGKDTVPPVTAVLGLDHEGAPLLLRLPSPNVAHVLIAGTTGSGKTALARSIVVSLALFNSQRTLQLVLVDPKGRGFGPLAGLPHLLVPVISRVDEALSVLERVEGEMERRDSEGRCEPRLVVVLDELADLVQVGGRGMEEALTRLTQRGREAGIHLVACTQKPTAGVIGGLVKSNFPVRLVGSVASPEDAKIASGLAGTGAERLLGQGDFLVVAKGQVNRMQAAYVEPALMRQLAAARTPALLVEGSADQQPARGQSDLVGRLRTRLRLAK